MSHHNIHAFNAINISIQCGTLKGTLLHIQEIPTTSVTCVALDWHYDNLKSQLINASNTSFGYLTSPFRTTDNSIPSQIIHVAFTGRAQLLMKYLSLNMSNILIITIFTTINHS